MFKLTEGLIREKFRTLRETAQELGVSEIRVRQLCYGERFAGAFQFGGAWMIPVESLMGFERKKRGRKMKSDDEMKTEK